MYINLTNMIKKDNIFILLLCCTTAISLALLLKPTKSVYPISTQKTIEKRIEGKETIIREKGTAIDNSKKIIAQLNAGLFELQTQLDSVKHLSDTFNIIQIQDTMIHVLYRRDKEKDVIIKNQDTLIQAQRYIINSKDTVITTQAFDIKRLKKQRNISMLLNAILTTGLMIK